jgi:PAS domain S-box-containing protein
MGKTAQKRADHSEDQLESEKCYRQLVELSFDGIAIHSGGKAVYINPAGARLLGAQKPEDLLGRSIIDFVHPDYRDMVTHRLRQILSEGKPVDLLEEKFVRLDGTTVDVEVLAIPATHQGQPAVQVVFRDISQRKRAEAQLIQARDEWERTFDAVPNLIMILDGSHKILRVNQATADRLGTTPQELVGQTCYRVIHGTEEPPDFCPHTSLLADCLEHTAEVHEERLGGDFFVSVSPLCDTDGAFLGSVHVAHDITEQKKTEAALRESEERYRSLVENSHAGILIIDDNFRFEYVNDELCRILKYSATEVMGRDFREFLDDESRQLLADRYVRRQRGEDIPSRYEFNIVRKDGEKRRVEISVSVIKDSAGRVRTVAQLLDITERKRAEEALQKSEKKYRQLVENLREGIWVIDKDAYTTLVNPAMAEMLGYTVEEMEGKHLFELMDEAGVKIARQKLEQRKRGIQEQHDFEFLRKDGSRVYTSLETSPITDEEGNYIGALAGVMNITERVQAEERLKAALMEKEVLLKEIHHRVKNNLQVISSLLYLQSQYVQDQKSFEIMEESQHRIRSMVLVHEQLYQSRDLSRIDFGEYIRKLVTDLFRSYGVNWDIISLKINVEDILLGIDTAIPCGLIVHELVSNSLKHAFPDEAEGEIGIEFYTEGNRLTLRVFDNGVGLPKDLDFRNTDSMGLQLVRTLTRQLEGTIKLASSGGTEFSITFALSPKP